jgi:hypothetical protein
LRKLGATWLAVGLISVSAVTAVIACHSNPDIKGASVATVGSPTDIPTCAQVCNRLQALCGYAPVDCTDADGGGYCDLNITDPNELLCIGYGSANDAGTYDLTQSCETAWDCVANEVPPDDSTDDGGDDDSGDQGDDDSGDVTDGASE